jgi:hypothetical protein
MMIHPSSRRLNSMTIAGWRRFHVRLIYGALICTLCLASPLAAQEAQEKRDPPVVVINIASVDRLLNQAVMAFEAAGRPELSETIGAGLARVNDLKGIPRDRSMGIMIFLSGLLPEVVAYVPVQNIDEMMKTIAIGPVTTTDKGNGRYEILAGRQTLSAKVVGDYVYVANGSASLDREFPDPGRVTGRLSAVYDIAASINLKGLPQTTRDIFMASMRASAENNLQRRDNEPEFVHRMRRAGGMRNLEIMEVLVKEGDELTLGWSVSGDERRASFEAVFTAVPGSDFAKYFGELKGARSYFGKLLDDTNPMTGSISWKLDKSARKMFKEIVAAAESQLINRSEIGAAEGETGSISRLASVLNGMIESGHMDMVMQMVGKPPGPFVFVGGVKVEQGDVLSDAVGDILGRLKASDAFTNIRINAFVHKGVAVHRLEPARMRAQEQRVYGENPNLYLGVGESVFWFAFGGDEAPSELKRAIDRTDRAEVEAVSAAPIRFVINAAQWIDLLPPSERPNSFPEMARKAFSSGSDALRMEVRPIDDGLRFRLTFDEAFLRLAGSAVSSQIDRRLGENPE